jgi:hypothetical protein
MERSPRDEALLEGRRLLKALLGLDEATVPALLGISEVVLGRERTARCTAAVRAHKLTRRAYGLACLAALVVGTKQLGEAWWQRPHHRSDRPGQWDDGPAPDAVLEGGFVVPSGAEMPLALLQWWIADDAADALWGPPVDFVDLNSQRVADRIVLPPHARAGERLVASFDPGSRIDVDVVADEAGVLGSRLDLDSIRDAPPATAWWAWATCAWSGLQRLPGESGAHDPYAASVDPVASRLLRTWAAAHGVAEEDLGAAWRSTGDAAEALARADTGRRFGFFDWGRAVTALIDGDAATLQATLGRLDGH